MLNSAGFFDGDHPEIDMMASMFCMKFQIMWHYKECAACELDCASYVGLLKLLLLRAKAARNSRIS